MIWALHGFLGDPSDWDFFSSIKVHPLRIDQFDGHDFWEWASLFNAFIRSKQRKENFLLGYSLGGRLALHALLDDPSLWKGAIIVSSHTGLSSVEEKKERYLRDEKWAERFLKEEWHCLMEDWNQQMTLKHDQAKNRNLENYSRENLAQLLKRYSLGNQENLKERIEDLNLPFLWVVGERDEMFKSIGQSLRFLHPKSCLHTIKGAYHRAPWMDTEYFQELVENFQKLVNNN